MYFQPYGDEQQLNLNWIINEIINLHKQLDPDYETPSFTQVYPYSNLNRLNLDWVLTELKALKELAPEPAPTIDIQAVAEALVALPFDSTKPYQIYDYISRDGEIWRATEPIAAGGDWDSTKWFKTTLGTDLAVLDRWINTINSSLSSEIETRQNDDTTLQNNINNEALARQQADTTLRNTIEGLTSADISDDSDAGGATVKASLNNLKGSLNALPANRLKGKKIAIYGDSWASPDYGELGKTYIENVTGVEVHRKNFGGGTLAQVYTQCWDSYNADIYIIEAGINDQIGNTSGNTFAANINTWLTAIRNVNPNAEIYFVTIPYVTSLLQNDKMYPPEFFRIAVWALSGWKKFGVINALKWTDIELRSDRLHPTEASYDKIGKHIVSALINFGDEETHISELSNFGRDNNQLLLVTRGGSMFIQTQNLSVTSNNNSWYNMTINDNLNTTFANGEVSFMNETTLQIGLMRYQTLYPKKLLFTGAGITAGAVISNPSALLPIWVNDWYRPKFS